MDADKWVSPDGAITLIHGDCRDVLPTLARCDLLLTDPPYGIGVDGRDVSTSSHGGRKPYEFKGWDAERPSLVRELISTCDNAIIWGGNYFVDQLYRSMGWLVWDKGQDIRSSDYELAFTTYERALRRLVLNRVALLKDGAVHPTQKPVRLIEWCIDYAGPEVETILDPFLGSGTTAVAAMRKGRKFIGIERDAEYFDIAVKRIEAELGRHPLFDRETA